MNHTCQHEDDIENFKTELNDGDKEFDYIKGELVLIKDALGVKSKENGERDKQIHDALQRTDDLGKKTEEEDGNLKDKVDALSLNVAQIQGALGLAKDKSERKFTLTNMVLAAILGFIFALSLAIIQHCTLP